MADLIPVIRGTMGGREYYMGKMTFQELAAKVGFYTDLDASRDLDNLLQRELSKRSVEMTQYLLRQPERFYGAIIVAAWGGRPNYIKVRMEDHPLLDDDFEFGLLKFDGRQLYFALDGQHRLRSIKDAIGRDNDLRNEEVSVIFVTHDRTEEGNVQTRRLFHTLNRYARPTTAGENIALDEDNVVSIATRMLLKSGIVLFSPRHIELVRKNLTKRQTDKFTSLAALYDFHLCILDALYDFKRDKEYLVYRPDALHIDNVYNGITILWNEIRDRTSVFRPLESEMRTAGEIREPNGDPAKGHLLFRPLGLRIYGLVLATALSEVEELPIAIGSELDGVLWTRALDRISRLPMTIGELPWRGTIFRNNKIETGALSLASRLACYMIGIGVQNTEKLLEDYQGHLDDDNAVLPTIIGQ